jgi:hypothetical protein
MGEDGGRVRVHPHRQILARVPGDVLCADEACTGWVRAQVTPSVLNADAPQGARIPFQLTMLKASVPLPGHGQPWTGGLEEAIGQARSAEIHMDLEADCARAADIEVALMEHARLLITSSAWVSIRAMTLVPRRSAAVPARRRAVETGGLTQMPTRR